MSNKQRIQVLLDEEVHKKLVSLIIEECKSQSKLLSISEYVRILLEEHIKTNMDSINE